MSSREGKDTAYFLERREQASKKVKIQFINPDDFNVLDENGEIKYFGTLRDGGRCSCPSFLFGQQYDKTDDGSKGESRYEAEHGHPFQDKHLIRANSMKLVGLFENEL